MIYARKKGQSTAEYAIVIGLVIAAAVAMQIYVKRGIQGKIRDASDANITYNDISVNGVTINGGDTDYGVNNFNQYEPNESNTSTMTQTSNTAEKVNVSQGGAVTRNIVGSDIFTGTGNQVTQKPQ